MAYFLEITWAQAFQFGGPKEKGWLDLSAPKVLGNCKEIIEMPALVSAAAAGVNQADLAIRNTEFLQQIIAFLQVFGKRMYQDIGLEFGNWTFEEIRLHKPTNIKRCCVFRGSRSQWQHGHFAGVTAMDGKQEILFKMLMAVTEKADDVFIVGKGCDEPIFFFDGKVIDGFEKSMELDLFHRANTVDTGSAGIE